MSYFKASIYALLTAPLILFNVSHATVLSYDTSTGVITNSGTGLTYLGWDVLKGLNYDETQEAINIGGYDDYHIADKEEAKTFFEAVISGWTGNFIWDTEMSAQTSSSYTDGTFGASYDSTLDVAMFIDGGTNDFGYMLFANNSTDGHTFHTDIGLIDNNWTTPVSFLMVANTTSAVPVPAAIWLFGTALIGLVGYGKRKSKVPV